MSETAKGIAAALVAYLIWGTSPLFWKALAYVPPVEVLAHRTFWAAFLFVAILALQRRLGALRSLLLRRAALIPVLVATVMVTANWGIYIWAIQAGRLVDASIGYYVFPLVAVVLGVAVFGERIDRMQTGAVVLAALGVVWLTWALGSAPWVALVLALTFGIYGMVKKTIPAGPVLSVAAEVGAVAPISLIWLIGVHGAGWTDFTGRAGGLFLSDSTTTALLVASGAVTAVPLMLFSYASRRVSYATVGVLQYLNPTLQFLVAVVVFGEPLAAAYGVALPLIWLAVIVYSLGVLMGERARRKAVTASGTP